MRAYEREREREREGGGGGREGGKEGGYLQRGRTRGNYHADSFLLSGSLVSADSLGSVSCT